jgi:hypothetical protein
MTWITRLVLALAFVLMPADLFVPFSAPTARSILITGRVTSAVDGSPIPNVRVMLVDGSFPIEWVEGARTDTDGNYTITSTPYATWWIRFDPPGDTYRPEL